ncbi:hypothetical protein [Larkinella rosea]|uniref:Uncharacterized protein n=1 Tax=Larkinella rosea TaxID=2025312 RepID=A0A3P1BG44_9BACT|nr:hypothetical protein [Larkinella rosea]RRB00070.1 hypothetical protein EHT25_25945 [Larkinella rosea]
MKTILLFFLLIIAPAAMAHTVLETRVVDNGTTLSIRINGHRDGRKIQFDRTFDVSRKNILEKDLIKYRAFQSVGLMLPVSEMPGLIGSIVGILVFTGTVLVMRFRRIKPGLQNPI